MGNNTQDIVFIQNTLSILKQYDSFKNELEQSYARSLFINSCVGLLVVPRSNDKVFDELSKENISNGKWCIREENITLNIEGDFSVGAIARHLRNSVMHNRLTYDCDLCSSTVINEITFCDKKEKDVDYNFQATLKFEIFREFVLTLAQYALDVLEGKVK